MKTKLERALEQHHAAVALLNKTTVLRDKALRDLIRTAGRLDDAARTVGRTQKRLDKARAEERAERLNARKRKTDAAEPITV